MISACNRWARAAARGVLPEAVGPRMVIKSYLFILKGFTVFQTAKINKILEIIARRR
jgi:hypothetical protein